MLTQAAVTTAQLNAVWAGRKPAFLETDTGLVRLFAQELPQGLHYVEVGHSACIYHAAAAARELGIPDDGKELHEAVRQAVESGDCGLLLGYGAPSILTRPSNQLRILYKDRERDTVKAAEKVVDLCRKRGISPSYCWGDVCGLGVGIMQAAAAMHRYRLREFNGGAPATDEHYCNLNAQAWHYLRQSLERGEVCFPDGLDAETIDQLTDRLLEWDSKGRLRAESKEDMKRRGVHSPDRADALVMAWWAGRYMEYADTPPPPPTPHTPSELLPVPAYNPNIIL